MKNLNMFFESPLFQYLVSPGIIAGMVMLVVKKSFHFGELIQRFNHALIDIDKLRSDTEELKKDMKHVTHDIHSIKTHLNIIKTHLVEKTGLNDKLFE